MPYENVGYPTSRGARRQRRESKTRRRTRPSPFSHVRTLTEAPLSDFAVSRPGWKMQLVRPIRARGNPLETVESGTGKDVAGFFAGMKAGTGVDRGEGCE